MIRPAAMALIAAVVGASVFAQTSPASQTPTQAAPPAPKLVDPFPAPIEANGACIAVDFVDFATIPSTGASGTEWPRMMLLVDEPATKRMFVNTMQGMLYSLSYDGKTVTPYVDINDAKWGNPLEARGSERGFQSFAFHPRFGQRGPPATASSTRGPIPTT